MRMLWGSLQLASMLFGVDAVLVQFGIDAVDELGWLEVGESQYPHEV